LMSDLMLIQHNVRDYDEWKRGYDAHLPKRTEAGMTEKCLACDSDDPNDVTMLFEVADLDLARSFADSDDLRETMQRCGVISKPDVQFLKN
jgi:hypothetical protein